MTAIPSATLRVLFERRIDRRRLLGIGAQIAALSLGSTRAWASEPSALGFKPIAASRSDAVLVPDGYAVQTVLRWGDPLAASAAALDAGAIAAGALLEPKAAAEQALQFGYNCDGIGLFPLDTRRLVLCANHEFPSPPLMFPGWEEARAARTLGAFVKTHPQCVAYMQASVGLSVVELELGRESTWGYRVDSRYNRRITAHTPIEIAGPARLHPLLNPRGDTAPLAFGTFGNCAAGKTPWGTYLTAEENVDDYFGNGGRRAG